MPREGDGVAPDVQVPANEALTTAQRMALDRLARSSDAAYRQAIAAKRYMKNLLLQDEDYVVMTCNAIMDTQHDIP